MSISILVVTTIIGGSFCTKYFIGKRKVNDRGVLVSRGGYESVANHYSNLKTLKPQPLNPKP